MTDIVTPGADDWRELREVRLAALDEAPEAFCARLADEEALDEAAWRERAESAHQVLARDDSGAPSGIAVGIRQAAEPDDRRELVSMWVAPGARGRGVAAQMVAAVADWARSEGASELALWVIAGNDPAIRAYEKFGFRLTGEERPSSADDDRIERRMLFSL